MEQLPLAQRRPLLKSQLQWEDKALEISGCRQYPVSLSKAGAGENSVLACRRCAVDEEIFRQYEELWEQEGKLHSIREHKKDVDGIFIEILQRKKPEPVTAQREDSQRLWSLRGKWRVSGWETQEDVTPGKRRRADLQLQNGFSVLVAGKGEKAIPGEAIEPPDEPCVSTKRKS